MSDAERRLFDLMLERCYREGEFTLSSGEKSKFYFDAKSLFMSSEGTFLIGKVLYEKLKDLEIQAIGGLEVGAIPLTTAVLGEYHRNNRLMEGFFVRNEAKKHGTKKLIEGTTKSGWKVAIVDDVATKGGSIMKAVKAARLAECQPALIAVLVDRQEGAAHLFAEEKIPFMSIFTIDQFKVAYRKS